MSDIVLSLHRLRVTGGLDKRNEMFGTLAERLGTGLQNRIQQFESARYLKKEFLTQRLFRNSFFCALLVILQYMYFISPTVTYFYLFLLYYKAKLF